MSDEKNNRIPPEKKWKPNDEQRLLLLALQDQAAKESSVANFCRKFVPFTRSQYDQIMDVLDDATDTEGKVLQSYFDRVSQSAIERKFEEIKFILDEIPLKRVQLARIKEFNIIPTSKILALEQAIRDAKETPGPERLIVVLGPTGGGKTVAANYLVKKNARFVEVRDIWRFSDRGAVPLGDICKGVGMRSWSNIVARAQDQLIAFCGELDIVICFDEGEHFGAVALNLLKLLLNKTRLVPVIFVVPEKYDEWFRKFPNEANQIARRTKAIIDNSVIELSDTAKFFPDNQFKDAPAALDILVRDASKFGHYSLIKRVAELLKGVVNATHAGRESDLQVAISKARRQMIREKPAVIAEK
jgi:hypothetical protein